MAALRPGHCSSVKAGLVWVNVTAHPAADWIAQQISEAFPWDEAPRYLIRDRDGAYGAVVTRRLRHGHSRQAHLGRFAVAKLLRRTTDRHDPVISVAQPTTFLVRSSVIVAVRVGRHGQAGRRPATCPRKMLIAMR
jgi:hypothetical protein